MKLIFHALLCIHVPKISYFPHFIVFYALVGALRFSASKFMHDCEKNSVGINGRRFKGCKMLPSSSLILYRGLTLEDPIRLSYFLVSVAMGGLVDIHMASPLLHQRACRDRARS